MTIEHEDYELYNLKEEMEEYVKNKAAELISKNDPKFYLAKYVPSDLTRQKDAMDFLLMEIVRLKQWINVFKENTKLKIRECGNYWVEILSAFHNNGSWIRDIKGGLI